MNKSTYITYKDTLQGLGNECRVYWGDAFPGPVKLVGKILVFVAVVIR